MLKMSLLVSRFKNFLRKPNLFKIVAGILVFFLIFRWAKKLFKRAKVVYDTKDFEASTHEVSVTDSDSGTTGVNLVNTKLVATEIYDCFYNNDPMGWTEDETGAIQALRSVPKSLVHEVSAAYSKITDKGRTMYDDFVRFLDRDEMDKIRHLFL